MRASGVVVGVIAGLLECGWEHDAGHGGHPGGAVRPLAARVPRDAPILHASACPMLADPCPPPLSRSETPHDAHAPHAAGARRSLRARRALARAARRTLDRARRGG